MRRVMSGIISGREPEEATLPSRVGPRRDRLQTRDRGHRSAVGHGIRRLGAVVVAGTLTATGVAAVTSAPSSAAPPIVANRVLVVDKNAYGGKGGVIGVDTTVGTQTDVSFQNIFEEPVGIASDNAGNVYVADSEATRSALGAIIQVDRSNNGAQTVVSSERLLKDPIGVVVDTNGDLLVADRGAGAVIRINPWTNQQTYVSQGGYFIHPSGIAVEANGNIVVVDADLDGGRGGVVRINPTGPDYPSNNPSGYPKAQQIVSEAGLFANPWGLTVSRYTSDILVVDPDASGGAVIKIEPNGGAQTRIAFGAPFGDPRGIVVESDHTLLVADTNGKLFRLATGPTSTTVTTVSSGGKFVDPMAVILTPVTPVQSGPYATRTYFEAYPGATCLSNPTYTVPAAVTRLAFQVAGGAGVRGVNASGIDGSSSGGVGGWGQLLTGELDVTPGQVIAVSPGSNGTGGARSANGGAGGAMSFLSADVLRSSIDLGDQCLTRSFLVVAGGGGGGGGGDVTSGGAGGDGGAPGGGGANGHSGGSGCCVTNHPGRGGGGGTQSAVGAGGSASGGNASPGASGYRSTGGNPSDLNGGGGGGGYYGGGAGGDGSTAGGGGGGGGSSYVDPNAVSFYVAQLGRSKLSPPSITLKPASVATSVYAAAVPVAMLAGPLGIATVTATLSPLPSQRPVGLPIGSVDFTLDGKPYRTVTPNELLGTATISIGNLPAGFHTVVARYSGNGLFTPGSYTLDILAI